MADPQPQVGTAQTILDMTKAGATQQEIAAAYAPKIQASIDDVMKHGATREEAIQAVRANFLVGDHEAYSPPSASSDHGGVHGIVPKAPTNGFQDTANAITQGWQSGSTGIAQGMLSHKGEAQVPVEGPEHPNLWQNLLGGGAKMISDLPAQLGVGAALSVPSVMSGVAAGAAVPVAGETGVSEVGGAVLGEVGSQVVTWGVSSGVSSLFDAEALYTASDRAKGGTGDLVGRLADLTMAIKNRQPLTERQQEFAKEQLAIWKSAGFDATVGGVTGGADKLLGVGLTALKLQGLLKFGLRNAGDVVAMLGTGTALNGKLPTPTQVLEASIFSAGMGILGHGVDHVAAPLVDAHIKPIITNLGRKAMETGQTPAKIATAAATDPHLRTQLVAKPRPTLNPPAGSSETPHNGDTFTIPRAHGAFDVIDQHHAVIGRTFDEADAHEKVYEGGKTVDQGGETNQGISRRANPDLDPFNMSPRQLAQVRYNRYWIPSGAETAPDEFKLPLYDTAMNEGPGTARLLYKESGGSLQKFMELRADKYAKLAASGKYTPGQVHSWERRLQDQGFKTTLSELGSREPGEVTPLPKTPVFTDSDMDLIHDEANQLGVEGSRKNLFGIGNGEGDNLISKNLVGLARTSFYDQNGQEKDAPTIRTPAAFIAHEVAPAPGSPIEDRWNAMPEGARRAATVQISREVVPQVLAHVGEAGKASYEAGGWMDKTNPNIQLGINSPELTPRVAALLGHILRQDEMMASGKDVPGAFEGNFLRIKSPQLKTMAGTHALWQELRTTGLHREALGHSTDFAGKATMRVLLPDGVDAQAAAKAAQEHFGARAKVDAITDGVQFYGKKGEYDLSPADREFADKLRAVVDQRMQETLATSEAGHSVVQPNFGKGFKPIEPGEEKDAEAGDLEDAEHWESQLPPGPEGDKQAFEMVASRISGIREAPKIWEKVQASAHQLYLELFNPNDPIRKLVNAVQKGGPLPDAANPNFLYNLAGNSQSRSQHMIEREMIDTDGRVIGKGLNAIMDPITKGKQLEAFLTYATSKWAMSKALKNKETGVDIEAAKRVVDVAERDGLVVPGADLDKVAAEHGVGVNIHAEGDSKVFDRVGPHYDPRTHQVHLSDWDDERNLATYGPGLDSAAIKAHEMGHALAYEFEAETRQRALDQGAQSFDLVKVGALGKGDWGWLPEKRVRDLEDELTITSRKFKPGLWDNMSQRTHVTKNSELIADGIATWMTDPIARTRMPELHDLLGSQLDKLGEIPTTYGTPMQQAFQELMDWQNGTWRYLYHSDMISRDFYIRAIAENDARVPGYRADDDVAAGVKGAGPGKTVYNSAHAFLGSEKKLKPIMQSLYQDAFLRTELGDRNRANIATKNAAEMIGQVAAVKGKAQKITFDVTPADLRKAGIDADNGGTLSVYRVLNRNLGDDQVPIFEGGNMKAYKFADPDLTKLLRSYGQVGGGVLYKIMGGVTNVTRQLITLNPEFPIRLAGYDMVQQFVTGVGLRNTVGETIAGGRELLKSQSDWKDAWNRSGGAERIFGGQSKNAWISDKLKSYDTPAFSDGVWNAVRSPFDALRAWGQFLNESQRLGGYIKAVEGGQSDIKAGVTSSESAFHRPSYGGPVLRMINAVQPFTAAYAHSLELIARAQLGGALKDNTRITGEPFNAVAFTAKSLLAITLPTLLLWYANKDKEWYKAAPDWQKDNGLLVRVGGDGPDGHTIFWKFPPVISLLYGGIPRRIAESVVDQDPHAFDNMMTSIGTSLLPPGGLLGYNVFLPFIEHVANHSFFRNQPLVTDGEAHRLGPEQFNQYSTQLGKNISQMLNDSPLRMQLAPAVIDNYIKDWGGTLGSDLLRLSDNLSNAVNPDKPASHLEDWPLFAGFMSRFPAANAAPIAAFRDQVKQMDQVHGSLVTAIQEGNLDRFKQIVEGNPTAALIHALRLQGEPHPEDITPYLNVLQVASQGADMQAAQTIVGADKMLKAADQFIDRVNAAPHSDLTPNDKRQLADLTFAQVQQMSERARDVMDDAGISAHGHPSAARTEADKAALEDAMVKLKETILKGNVRPEPGEAAAATQEPVEAPDE